MKTPTISQIKYGYEGHFFDRSTLKFFGQRMKDFKVWPTEYSNIFETYAKHKHGASSHFWRAEGKGVFKLLGTTITAGQ